MPGKFVPTVLFNASVVLAGLKSKTGGSAKLLFLCKKKKIKGIVSEIIFDEVVRNSLRIGLSEEEILRKLQGRFSHTSPPNQNLVGSFKEVIAYLGDAHVLASAKENKADFLVSLDAKHILSLSDKIKEFKIVSPGQLIEILKLKSY